MKLRLRMWGWMLALALASAPLATADERPFRIIDGQVVITVTIRDRQVPALLDTGASHSLIEASLAKELGIRTSKIGPIVAGASGRDMSLGFTPQILLDLGAGPVKRNLGVYPSGAAFAAEGVRLLIGMDFLKAAVVSLDFERMMIDVQSPGGFTAPAGKPVVMVLEQAGWRRRLLPVDLDGARAELLLDTAASGALHLDAAYVAKAPVLKALPASAHQIAGIDGIHDHTAIVLPGVTLGGETFRNVRASSSPLSQVRRGGDVDGVVGVELLKRFNWVIDFGGGRIWMTPNANRDAPMR
jgi:predicted aspartyl protease